MSNYNVYPHSCHFLRESTKKLQNYIFHKKFQKNNTTLVKRVLKTYTFL